MPDDLHGPPPPPPAETRSPRAAEQVGEPRSAPPQSPQPPFQPQYPHPPYGYAPGSSAGYGPGYATAGLYRRPHSAWFWPVVILSSIFLLALVFFILLWTTMHAGDGTASPAFGSDRIAVIDINGVILDADKIDLQLRKFGDDSSVKAIILHINSPGGGAAASQEIFHEVQRVRTEKHKRIVASVESVGASGAYYIASACDRIYANDASVVGSIGVIMEWTNYGDLYRWAKLKPVVIHAGELKDAGDPTHDMTPKEAAYFQSLVDNMYAQFIHDVADGRHTSVEKIAPLATGQVWTGQQSLPLGLIDKVGGFRSALIETARDAGIKGEPAIVRPASARKGLAALIQGDADELFPTPGKLLDRSPGFFFMWK